MRRVIGGIVLIIGLGGLGYYGAKNNAVQMEDRIAQAAQDVAATSLHGIDTKVQGRDIEASGIADTVAEKERILQDLENLPGRRVVREDLQVLPVAKPYRFSAVHAGENSDVQIKGDVPMEAFRNRLTQIGTQGASGLRLSSGAPEGWAQAVEAGLQALDPLEAGELHMADRHILISGTARTPVELAQVKDRLAQLPENYVQDLEIALLDDGTPAQYTLQYSASEGARIEGKLPAGLTREALAGALGLREVSGEPRQALTGEAEPDLSVLAGMAEWLPFLETFRMQSAEGTREWQVQLPKGGDTELVSKRLQSLLGEPVAVTQIDPASLPAQGTQRLNAASGKKEVLRAGYWLPDVDFQVSEGECNARAEDVVNSHKVNFLSGSARLDAKASRAINQMSAIVLKCVLDAEQHVEVGGHTDNQGESAFNMNLSQQRADAVRAALIRRGVPSDAITARGYGENRPVADNTTTNGRAANRRTTLAFSK